METLENGPDIFPHIWDLHLEKALLLTLPPSSNLYVCVLVSLRCSDGFHSPLATMRLAHQVDSIRIDNPFQ